MEKNNFLEFRIQDLKISETYLKDVLQCLLNTIFYQRAQGIVELNVRNCEILKNTSYMSCGSLKVDKDISDLIKEIQQKQKQSIYVVLEFYMIEEQNGVLQEIWNKFISNQNKLLEKWIIPIEFVSENESSIDLVDEILQNSILEILEISTKFLDHFPQNLNSPNLFDKLPFKVKFQFKLLFQFKRNSFQNN